MKAEAGPQAYAAKDFAKKPRVHRRISPTILSGRGQLRSGLRRVQQTDKPLSLSIWKNRKSSSSTAYVWIFDLFRIIDEHVFGTQFQREHAQVILGKFGFTVYQFDELIGFCPISKRRVRISFGDLQSSVLKLYRKLPSEVKRKMLVLSFDENNFVVPAIFHTEKYRPALLLVNPFWGSLTEWLKQLGRQEVLPQALEDPPMDTLAAQCREYGSPLFALGRNSPPHDLQRRMIFFRTPGAGRFLNRAGKIIPVSLFDQPGFRNNFEYGPRPWHRSAVIHIVQWTRNLFSETKHA